MTRPYMAYRVSYTLYHLTVWPFRCCFLGALCLLFSMLLESRIVRHVLNKHSDAELRSVVDVAIGSAGLQRYFQKCHFASDRLQAGALARGNLFWI